MKKILFICTGNICRSPTAHAIARHKAQNSSFEKRFYFDSAGTDSYHENESPDFRSVEVGRNRGISFAGIAARKIKKTDFENFDYLMCMDRSHFKKVTNMANQEQQKKIKLFLEFCEVENMWNDEVVDPYYKGGQAFEDVFDVLEAAVENMFEILAQNENGKNNHLQQRPTN